MSAKSMEIKKNSVEKPDQKIFTATISYSIKHPLQNCWTLWYFENIRGTDWQQNQKEVATFTTIEDFWSLYSNVKLASEIPMGCDYSLFKNGIKPMWEDDANKTGGRWLINFDKRQQNQELDRIWLDIMLCLIGEGFEHPKEICGAVVNMRMKGNKIAVWTADATHTNAVIGIGTKLRDRIQIPLKTFIGYQMNKDLIADKGASSVTKYIYTI